MTKRGFYVFRCYGEKGKHGYSVDVLAKDEAAAKEKALARFSDEKIKLASVNLFCKYSQYCGNVLSFVICIA